MSFTVKKVSSAGDLKAFMDLPDRIYRDDPHYVHPLRDELKHFFDRQKNPFFKHAVAELWVACNEAGETVGRIAAAVDQYSNKHHNEEIGFFGFYEAEDDPHLARTLLETARQWIADQGMKAMRGPGCFTSNHDWFGLQIDGQWTRPVVGMPYNPPYYQQHFESFGLTKAKDLLAWHMDTKGDIPPKMAKLIERIIGRPGLTIRPMNMKRFEAEAALIRQLYNDCWSANWGFIPMDDAEFAYSAKDMKTMVNPDYLLIAELDGTPVGFSLTIPDFNQATQGMKGRMWPLGWLKFLLAKRKIKYARNLLMGVLPEYRQMGIDMAMVYRTLQAVFANGISSGECSWILEDNGPMNNILAGYGAEIYKTYRIFEKSVT